MEKHIKAVIFDLDGTLIDTEKYYVNFGQEIIQNMGYTIDKNIILSMRSLNHKFAKLMLKELLGEGFDFEYFHQTRRERVRQALEKNGIEKKPDVDKIIAYLKEKEICTAVATATDYERACSYLEQIGIDDKLDKIISVSNVANGKPMPDVYLEACRQLNENPNECIAVEDSYNGVKSAYDAGMRVIMVPDLTKPEGEMNTMICGVADTLWDVRKFL